MANSIRMGRGHVELAVDQSALERGLSAASARLSSFARTTAAIGATLFASGAALAGALNAPLAVFATYEQALADLRAATGLQGDEFNRLRAAIEGTSRATGQSLPEVTQAFSDLVRAGASVDDVINGMGIAAVRFARVSGIEMGETARSLVGIMNLFQREGLSTEAISNFVAAADSVSSTTLPLIVEAFASGGGALADYNQSLETTSTLFAILGNNLVEGANAGTALRVLFNRLATGNETAGSALDELGIGLAGLRDEAGQLLPAVQIIGRLQEAIGRFGQQDQDRLRNMLAGERGGRPLGILLREGVDGFNRTREAMQGQLTVADRFAIMTDTLQGSLRALWTQVQAVAVAVGEALAPALRTLRDFIMPVLQLVQVLVTENTSLLRGADTLSAVLMALGATFLIVAGGTHAMNFALMFLAPAIAFAKTGFGLFTIVMMAYNAVLGVAHFLTWGLKAAIIALAVVVVGVFAAISAAVLIASAVVIYFAARTVLASEMVQRAWRAVRDAVASAVQFISAQLRPLFDFLIYAARFWLDALRPIGAWFESEFMPLLSRIGDIAGNAVSAITGHFGDLFSGLGDAARSGWAAMRDAISVGDWDTIWQVLQLVARVAWENLKLFADEAWMEVQDAATDIFRAIGDLATDTFHDLATMIRISLIGAWAEVKAFALEALADIAAASADALIGPLADLARGRAAGLRLDAQLARSNARQAAGGAESQAAGEAIGRGMERVARDMIEEAMRAARQRGDRGEIDRLQGELDTLGFIAEQQRWFEQFAQGAATGGGRSIIPAGPGGAVAAGAAGRTSIAGGFLAGGLFGALGAVTETPLQVIARLEALGNRLTAEQTQVIEQLRREIMRIGRVG